MKLYKTVYDGQVDWIEAKSFGDAVLLWRKLKLEEWKHEFEEEDEPESVELVSGKPVVRA